MHRDYDAAVSGVVKCVRLHPSQTPSGGGASVNAALMSGTPDSEQDAIRSVQIGSLTSSVFDERTETAVSERAGQGRGVDSRVSHVISVES